MTNYRIELREKILKAAMHEFLRKGIKAVKMDDIANSLAVSKRTVYELYANKEDLLLECLRLHEEAYDNHMTAFATEEGRDVIDVLIEFLKCQVKSFTDASPMFFCDLHRYGKVVDLLEEKRADRSRYANDFFHKGVQEGFFRSDVDYSIVLRIVSASMDYVMQEQMYRDFDIRAIYRNILFLFLRGVCTTRGVERLDAFIAHGMFDIA